MNDRKSILLFMNGFGMEVPKSFNVYTASLMPSLAKLSNYYPFTSVFASGSEVGLNKGQLSSFRTGYAVFSSAGKPNKKSTVVQAKMQLGEFETNPVIMASINHAVQNKSRLHILFNIGEKTEDRMFEHLRKYAEFAVKSGVTQICLHLFLGDNSVSGMKISAGWIKNLKTRGMIPQMRIVSIAGRKYMTDAPKDEKIAYYRMIVSGVGEIWATYEETLQKKYQGKENDDTMGGFLTVRENVIRANDSVFNFNYDNTVGAEYLDIIQNPSEFFPVGKVPLNVAVNALFEVSDNANVPYAFESELPDHYFFEQLPANKRVLILADRDRVQYISKCLNGFRDQFNPNINVWPIDDKNNRFELMSQYLAAYISQNIYDLIIADCEIFSDHYDEKTIDQLRKNLAAVDKVLNVAYTRGIEKGYTLYATSLYGIKKTLFLTKTYEEIDFSQKTPLLIAGNDIRRENTILLGDGNFTQIAQVIQRNLGIDVPAPLVGVRTKSQSKKGINLAIIVVLIVFALFVLYILLYTQGII